jgi:hypothetical protein
VLTDRYDNPLTTTSEAARNAYVEGCDLVLTQWPGAVAAFDRALASDPDFALAYTGRARALQMASDMPAARAAIAAAKASEGSIDHFWGLVAAGRTRRKMIEHLRGHKCGGGDARGLVRPAGNG